MTLDDIIANFKSARLPAHAALAEAVPLGDELAPQVLELADKAYRGVFLLPDEQRLLMYGLHVLAAARTEGLYPRLLALTRLSEEEIGDLFPEHGPTTLTRLLLSVWNGNADTLFHMLEHADLSADGRWVLFDCLARLTFDGRIPRERMQAFLDRFERESLADDDDDAWWGWEDAVIRLGLVDLEPALQRVWTKPANTQRRDYERAEKLEALRLAVAAPADPSAFDRAELRPVDDPAEGLAWVDRLAGLYASWAAEAAASQGGDQLSDDDVARDVQLSDEDASWLARFLVSRQVPDTTMSIEMLDGLFTALVIGPALVLPSEYEAAIWGTEDGSGPAWDSAGQQQYFEALLARHWDAIFTRSRADAPHVPIFLPASDAERGFDWAEGFLTGVDMAAEQWQPIYEDRRAGDLAMSIVALVGDDPELFEERLTPKIRAEIVDGLPAVLRLINAYWRSPDHRLPRREPVRSVKIGRNDPCPCGSGRKYKKCCAGSSPPVVK